MIELLFTVMKTAKIKSENLNTAPHYRKLPLMIGGVMRCCVESLNSALVNETEGEIVKCKYCKSSLILKNKVWQWNREGKDT